MNHHGQGWLKRRARTGVVLGDGSVMRGILQIHLPGASEYVACAWKISQRGPARRSFQFGHGATASVLIIGIQLAGSCQPSTICNGKFSV